MHIFARLILSLEPYLVLCAVFLFWFPSNFPAESVGNTGIVTEEWLWLITGLLPLWLAFWVNNSTIWKSLSRHVRWILGVAGILAYFVIYINLPFLPTPSYAVDRADWFWFLAIFPVMITIRWSVYGRGWTFSMMDVFAFALIVLCIINIAIAPYPVRGEGWVGLGMLFRPLLGILLMGYMVEVARQQGFLDGILQAMLVLTIFLTLIALAATQWTVKSTVFVEIIRNLDFLPNSPPFFRRNSVNPNEIAGGLTWLIPFCGVLVFYPWYKDRWLWRGIATFIFITSLGALILGQSRFAIIGVLGALGVAGVLLLPTIRLRLIAIGVLVVVGILQIGILFNVFLEDADLGLSERDARSSDQRLSIWESSLQMVQDYPLTGVGLNNFRVAVRRDYPVVGHEHLNPPHAHNELVQIITDMGIGGAVVFIGLHGVLLFYLWRGYRHGKRPSQIVAIAVGVGILAHGIYGIGDAIPIWDRLSFIFWLLLGIGVAQYKYHPPKPQKI